MELVRFDGDYLDAAQASEIAQAIYSEVYGVDDVAVRATTIAEIEDWLREGDWHDGDVLDVPALATEWREYAQVTA